MIDPAFETAKKCSRYFAPKEFIKYQNHQGSLEICFSAQQKNTAEMAKLILGSDIPPITGVDLTIFAK